MRVLIVKLSSLGDVVHSLPAAMDIQKMIPGVQIDWVVEPAFASLLELCPAVQRVIPCGLRQWRKSWWTSDTRQAWRVFKQDLKTHAYDAVIDLQGLTKSAFIASQARLQPQGKRFAMANPTEGSAFELPTRWVANALIPCPWHVHAVNRGRHVCSQALSYVLPGHLDHGLECQPHPDVGPKTIAFLHGSSRLDKSWGTHDWQVLGQTLQTQGFQIALPHANDEELKTAQAIAAKCPEMQIWPRCDLIEISQRLSACVGAIGVDSGVSHMAVALGLPHVQLYNFDTAWRTGPIDQPQQMAVFAKPTPTISMALSAWNACWQEHLLHPS